MKTADAKASKLEELLALPVDERLKQRIIDGERKGLEADLDEAMQDKPALQIINEDLLDGMKVVGELFGSGQMQLPFVLQSAEVMKTCVAYLEPHMEKAEGDEGKGTIVLATVKGDVHDIGKNLVDIILTNNGYSVVNLGIKQPINAIIEAAEDNRADVIGMSGLLVKSTVVMKENLEEINQRGLADKWPVMLGGAALTRAYVEQDLHSLFDGEVRYARDAFEGLRLMDAVMAVKKGVPGAALPERRERRVRSATRVLDRPDDEIPARVRRGRRQRRTEAAVLGQPDRQGHPAGRLRRLPGRAGHVHGPVGPARRPRRGRTVVRRARRDRGPAAAADVARPGQDRRRAGSGRRLRLLAVLLRGRRPGGTRPGRRIPSELHRFTFPRQRRDRFLCLSDFFRSKDSGELDVVAFQLVTMGPKVAEVTGELFAKDAYRDYLELHGLSVQLTEALAEYWHARVRDELGFGRQDGDLDGMLRGQAYQGSRYSFGYPACPNLEDRTKLVELLEPERIGVQLSEELQLHPEQSTDALVVHHPEAKYFST